MTVFLPALIALLAALASGLLIVRTANWHGALTFDTTANIQCQHQQATPRVGGVALWFGTGLAAFLFEDALSISLWLVALPAFLSGLAEDIFKSGGIRRRLLASLFSGAIGWSLTGHSLNHLNWPGVDTLLGASVVLAVALTCFALAGVTHAVNMIDGFNGLAAGTVVLATAAFFYLAASAGDTQLAAACALFIGALLGFLLVNWPRGRLFLGDGGAYLAGSALGWLAVLLNARLPDVSAWAILLICAYPIQEVLFSIWRRRRKPNAWGQPDRLHLHSLVGRRVVKPRMPRASLTARNSATGAVMLLANAFPIGWALLWPASSLLAVLGFLISAALYQTVYRRITRFARHKPTQQPRGAFHPPSDSIHANR
jgi:UDP-N-acetylmuramyl pentapeptide phosphotransferase/UDP-N-acetylglucosamine-1-phosphate transferase